MGELGARENLLTNKLSFARKQYEVLKDSTALHFVESVTFSNLETGAGSSSIVGDFSARLLAVLSQKMAILISVMLLLLDIGCPNLRSDIYES
jgi:hypothetical protein